VNSEITIVKLGGSLVTDKNRPLALNMQGIKSCARSISRAILSNRSGRLFLIHGGGSFGHYYATKFLASTTRKRISAEGVSRIASGMITLHSVILDRLVKEGVPCKTLMTSELLTDDGKRISKNGSRRLNQLYQNRLIPISFGNISVTQNGSEIISGDQIALSLARGLTVKRTIFAMDVDGIYGSSQMSGQVLKKLDSLRFNHGDRKRYDVTGGIKEKVRIGFRLAELGADVFYVNGAKSKRLESLMVGREDVISTKIDSKRI
jgi:isopentenyl phosphate kinase